MNLLPGRITIDPHTCGGKPIFEGTRIPVYIILEMLANREVHEEILRDYPNVTAADLQDAITFARNLAEIPGNPASTSA